MKTDIEIAHSIQLEKISEIAKKIGIERLVYSHGPYIAKIPCCSMIKRKRAKANSFW
jgi:formyltetrahydrofolate synthetase